MDLIIGDELVPGYSDKNLNSRFESKPLTSAMDSKVMASAVKGASLTIKGKGNVLHQLHQVSLPAYKRILLCFGANDYFHSKAKIDEIANAVNKALNFIRKKYRYVLVYGILPIPMYDKDGKSYINQRNQASYTLQDLNNMLSLAYGQCHVPVLNWFTLSRPVVSLTNYKERLKGGRFPTEHTYQLMANRIAEFVQSHPNGI